jgi:hypothetical protein
MAQTNYTPIQLYYSTTASAVPVNTNLASGELAINITDGLLFYKDNAGTVQKIGYKLTPTTAGGTGLTSFTANGIVYASSTSALATGSALTWSGTALAVTGTFSSTLGATIQGLTVGLGAGAVATNTAVGASALAGSNSGTGFNTAMGSTALTANTTGDQNTAVGAVSLAANTTGSRSVAVGVQALRFNTTATDNTAVGYQVAYLNTTGAYNTAFGTAALYSNTTASNNTAVGYQTLYNSNRTADDPYNTAIGAQAGFSAVTSAQVTYMGYRAGYYQTGSIHTAIGYRALFGASGTSTGNYNVAIGPEALYSNTTASNNTAVGYQAGYSNTVGGTNTIFGYQAAYSNTTSFTNVFIGHQAGYTFNRTDSADGYNTFLGQAAGYYVTTGLNNTLLGRFAGGNITTGSKNTILGCYSGNQGGLDIRTASNYIVLSDGDGNPRQIINGSGYLFYYTMNSGAGTNALKYNTSTGAVTYDTSSARYKDNIRDSIYGLSHVMQMRSTQFEYKDTGRSDVGLIAEELNPIIPELVGKNKDGQPDSVSYDRMVAVLVKAIQELKAEFDTYKSTHP